MTQTELLDTIRKEIERRREVNRRQYISSNGDWQQMCDIEDCLFEILSFLDPLEQSIKALTVEDVVEQGKRFGRKVEIINHDEAALQEHPVKSAPKWKWVEPGKEYPVGITREMDVNGDWQYCLSSGRLCDGCQYLSLAELERNSIDAGPYPIENTLQEPKKRNALFDKCVENCDPATMKEVSDKVDKILQELEVDLEKEIDRVIADYSFTKTIDSGGFKTTILDYAKIARHFYELGKNAK